MSSGSDYRLSIGGDAASATLQYQAMTGREAGGALSIALALVLLVFGRYALGQNEEDLGAMFYVVAPLALLGSLVATVAGLALLTELWRGISALVLACVAAVFVADPSTSDGEHAVMFGVYAVALLAVAGSSANRFRKAKAAAAPSPQREIAGVVLVVSRALLFALVAIGLVLVLFLILLVSSGYEG
jgi:hypothetical protein